jgi:hypothetical protein
MGGGGSKDLRGDGGGKRTRSHVTSTSSLLPFIHLLSTLISPLLFIYYLSILVEVLLRLLTYRGDLVLLYLVSKDHS